MAGLQDHLGADFHRAEAGGGVGGEVGTAGTGSEDYDAPLLEMAHRAAANVAFAYRLHLDRGENAGSDTDLLERILQR